MLASADANGFRVRSECTRGGAMKAVLHRQYGPPDMLTVGDADRPVVGDEDVLIRVIAAGVSIGDFHVVTGKPYLIRLSPFGGIPRPRHLVPGAAMAGFVEAIGSKVAGVSVGDEVFGQALNGAFAQYLSMPADLVALKPGNLSFEEAAAVPWGTTALQALRDAGELQAGEGVLVYGASGAVGTWAVQIAKALGAHVSAVCSTRNVDLVRSLGADEVIDYTKRDFAASDARYDVVLDLVGNRSLSDCRRALNPKGRYVLAAGGGDWLGPLPRIVGGLCVFMWGGRRLRVFMQKLSSADLRAMRHLIEAGAIRPVVERTWSIVATHEALTHVGRGHARGLNVIRIDG
jgi:NADPH:quinone reductase-like Zn-dependent oxidoreductase